MRPNSPAAGEARRAEKVAREGVPSPDVYLHAEQVFVSESPRTVMTILGSCVSVCLWDPLLGAGGMNHFLLPYHSNTRQDVGRYGNVAVRLLLERMDSLGCRRRTLLAKIFGGARITLASPGNEIHLGQKNVDLALSLLEKENISVVARDVGGMLGRKVLFNTGDGAAWVKAIGEGSDDPR
jgi:chemotaxis protein CheD